jgi:hypothetical protein
VSDRVIRDEIMRSRRFRKLPSDSHRLLFIYLLLTADPFGNLEIEDENVAAILRRDDLDPGEGGASGTLLGPLVDADLIRPYVVEGKNLAHIPRYRQRIRYGKGVIHRPPKAIEDPWIQSAIDNRELTAKDGLRTGRVPDAPPVQPDSAPDATGTTGARALTGTQPGRDGRSEVKRSEEKRSTTVATPTSAREVAAEVQTLGEKLRANGHKHPSGDDPADHAERVRAQAAAAVAGAPAWAMSRDGIGKRALALGLAANPGERWDAYAQRVIAADAKAKRPGRDPREVA